MSIEHATILFVAGTPWDQDLLDIQQERDELDEALAESKNPNRFQVVEAGSIQPSQLGRLLRRTERLAIMHFAGHGTPTGDFAFEDKDGRTKIVKADALGDLLEMATTLGLKLVVLNSCYSDENAQYIAEKVGVAVAMRGKIKNSAAVAFTNEFYSALGDSREFSTDDVQMAFNWAYSGLRLAFDEGMAKPRLFLRQRNLFRPTSAGQAQSQTSGNMTGTVTAAPTSITFRGNNYGGMQIGQNSGAANIYNH